MGSAEDIQAMLAFQRGDEKGFQVLYERYSRPILNYLYRFTWNRSVAEELTQEVFLRVCRAARTYEPRNSFRSWLYQIATNVGRNEVRRPVYSVRQDSLESSFRMPGTDRPAETQRDPASDGPEDMAAARRLEQDIQGILMRLPERQRSALLLCRHHGFSYHETAAIMGLREGAVKSLIHRATETLRKGLSAYLDSDSDEGERGNAMQEGPTESDRLPG